MASPPPSASPSRIAFLGGTGPLGRGLAIRLAAAGHRCVLGSREAQRAEEAAAEVTAVAEAEITGDDNGGAVADADVVVVAVPYDAMAPTLTDLADAIGSRIVVSCVNALDFDRLGPRPRRLDAGSAAEECQALLPAARVVGAFHHLSAVTLRKPGVPLDADVLVTGDDEEAVARVVALANALGGARGVHVGPLRLSAPVEDITAVLIAANKRYKAHASVRLTDLEL